MALTSLLNWPGWWIGQAGELARLVNWPGWWIGLWEFFKVWSNITKSNWATD